MRSPGTGKDVTVLRCGCAYSSTGERGATEPWACHACEPRSPPGHLGAVPVTPRRRELGGKAPMARQPSSQAYAAFARVGTAQAAPEAAPPRDMTSRRQHARTARLVRRQHPQ